MKVTNAFLANYAELRESLIFASGASPEWWTVPALNVPSLIAFVATIRLEESEIGKTYNFILELEPPEGSKAGLAFFNSRRDLSPNETFDGPVYSIFALNFPVPFNTVGLFNFVLSTSGESGVEEIARVPLLIRMANPQRNVGHSPTARTTPGA